MVDIGAHFFSANPIPDKKTGPTLDIIHNQVRGRIRLKHHRLYRNHDLSLALSQKLIAHAAINDIRINPIIGSVLVIFPPSRPHNEIILLIERYLNELLGTDTPSHAPGTHPKAPRKTVTPEPAATPANNTIPFGRFFSQAKLRQRQAQPSSQHSPQPPDSSYDAGGAAWHRLDITDALERCRSCARGLNATEASERLIRDGPNCLPRSERRSSLSIFLGQFNSLPVWLLGASAVVSVATGGLIDAAAIITVVIINAGIGFVTERQAERTIASLTQITAQTAKVIRDGIAKTIPAGDVVVGDVIELLPGKPVAADARLLQGSRLTVDESSLTGESMPIEKKTHRLSQTDAALAERCNMVYMGSMVTGGNGQALVIATGIQTEIGKIQILSGQVRPPPTPMQLHLDKLSIQLGILSSVICSGVFGIGMLRGYSLLQMLKSSISLAVAAVPEGLPTIATTILAMGIRNMRSHNVLIRHLGAVESLGSVQVLCLDKTGTLTINRMVATDAHIGMQPIHIEQGQFLSGNHKFSPLESKDCTLFLQVLALCNESSFTQEADSYSFVGSPTENALLELSLTGGINVSTLRESHPRDKVQYRAEGRPYMVTCHVGPAQAKLCAIKGHPLVLLSHCHSLYENGEIKPLTDEMRDAIEAENDRMSNRALRVLGVAYSKENIDNSDTWIWLGLVGMTDPIRPGMKELIARFHQAGIRTVMITGDQAGTATAIGQELQLSRKGQSLEVLESSRLENLEEDILTGLAQRVHIFARVTPSHKLKIVQALQKSGHVVAMTGDGINDGPALKAANIGVAMGNSGTEIARSVADIVLEDDNLHTKLVAINLGRTIYNNIRKSLRFLISTNLSEIEVMLAGVTIGSAAPLTPMQLLWVNLITDIFPGLALAMEKPEPGVMTQPPRPPKEPILRPLDLREMALQSAFITAGTLGSYGYALSRYGQGPQASTQAFMTITLAQLLHALSCRSDKHTAFDWADQPGNPYLNTALVASVAIQTIVPFLPGVRNLLGIGPLKLLDAAVVTAGAFAPLVINEGIKTHRLNQNNAAPKKKKQPGQTRKAKNAPKRQHNNEKEQRP